MSIDLKKIQKLTIRTLKIREAKKIKEAKAEMDKVQNALNEAQQSQIRTSDYFIEQAAKDGKFDVRLSHPGDELFKVVKHYYEAKGFRVSEYSTDEGYCNGDKWHITISW